MHTRRRPTLSEKNKGGVWGNHSKADTQHFDLGSLLQFSVGIRMLRSLGTVRGWVSFFIFGLSNKEKKFHVLRDRAGDREAWLARDRLSASCPSKGVIYPEVTEH